MPDLVRASRLLADAYQALSDQSLGRGALATAIGEARGNIAVAMKLLSDPEATERPG